MVTGAERAPPLAAVAATRARRLDAPGGDFQMKSAVPPAPSLTALSRVHAPPTRRSNSTGWPGLPGKTPAVSLTADPTGTEVATARSVSA